MGDQTGDHGLYIGGFVFVVMLALGSLATLGTRRHSDSRWVQWYIFLTAACIRFSTGFAIYEWGLIRILKDEDGTGWAGGADLARSWQESSLSLWELPGRVAGVFQGQHEGYRYLLAVLYFITGSPSRLSAVALNAVFGALACVLVFRVAASLFDGHVARRVALWTCFWPSLIIWSSLTVKEPVVILLEACALYACVRLNESGWSPRHLFLAAAVSGLLIPFRFYAAIVSLLVMSVTVGALGRRALRENRLFAPGTRRASARVLLTVILSLTPLLLTGHGLVAYREAMNQFGVPFVEDFRERASTGGAAKGAGSGVPQAYNLRTVGGFAAALGVGASHLLLAPFPWQFARASSLRMLLTLPELLIWWWLLVVAVIPGACYALRRRFGDLRPLVLFLLGFGVLYSLLFANVGLVFRQRAQLLPWLLIFGSVGWGVRALPRCGSRPAAEGPGDLPDRGARGAPCMAVPTGSLVVSEATSTGGSQLPQRTQ